LLNGEGTYKPREFLLNFLQVQSTWHTACTICFVQESIVYGYSILHHLVRSCLSEQTITWFVPKDAWWQGWAS